MLGVYLAPDGNHKDQVETLRAKAERWACNIQSSRANQEEVWTALHRTIPFSLGYSLPAVTLSQKECRYIMAPITKHGLPSAGISSTTPHFVKVGSISMGGLGIIDPYTHMGVSQITTFISNTWQQTPTGKLLETALDDLALELGLSTPWNTEYLKKGLKYATTPSWIQHLVRFSLEHEIKITWVTKELLQPIRENDNTIMESAMEYYTQATELQSINKVRIMALNVIWISDLGTADGQYIDRKWLFPMPHPFKFNRHIWPQRHHIMQIDWRRWRHWVRHICTNQEHRLRNPLGAWRYDEHTWTSNWDSFTTLNEEILYIRTDSRTGWNRHVKMPGRRQRRPRYYKESLRHSEMYEATSNLKRVSYTNHRTYIEVTSASMPPGQARPVVHDGLWGPINLFKEPLLKCISDTLNPVFIDSTEEINLLIRDFSRGTSISISDGSYLPESNQAAAAWIIESACGTQWIMGSNFVPGAKEEFSSYRSELTGLLAISCILRILAENSSQPRHVLVGCDGKAALNSLRIRREDVNANTPQADLISKIVDLWEPITSQPYLVHVQGHQDEISSNLSRLEKLNVLMDHLAKITARLQPQHLTQPVIPSLGIRSVEYESRAIRGNLSKTLYNGITDHALLQYYNKNFFLENTNVDKVAVDSFCHARTTVPTGMLKFTSKWLSNTLPTGKVMQQRKHRIFNRCP
jgi:hypothetical protein